jgi:hypothetical protein
MKRPILASWILLLFLVPSPSLPSHAQDAQEIQNSCRNFVQKFYDWYLLKPSWPRALTYKPSAFSSELSQGLREDYEAQAKVSGDIAGLDFDPLLNSQDPAQHYVVGRVNLKVEDTCWAEIHAVSSGKKSEKPDVLAAAVHENGRWLFVNFYYSMPDGDFSSSVSRGGLMTLLKDLREARLKAAKAQSGAKSARQPQNSVPPSKTTPVSNPTPQN